VPKLWSETIEAHRREVRDAILETTAALVTEHGLLSVTMARIAEATGIGRATLYQYFPDVETILSEWHERQISAHLQHLTEVRDRAGGPRERLRAVLAAYASIVQETREHHDTDVARFFGRDQQVARAEDHVRRLIRDLVADGVAAGDLRDDVPPDELAGYCLRALGAARGLPSNAAVRRLVSVTMSGLSHRPDV
jgi:AcrR family transcriptional regulator